MKITIEVILTILMVLAFIMSFAYDTKTSNSRTDHRVVAVITGAVLFVMLLLTNLRFV
jgi:hypothetical protein